MKTARVGAWCGAAVLVAALLAVGGMSGCSTLDRAYKKEVTWTNQPVVEVVTNTVVSPTSCRRSSSERHRLCNESVSARCLATRREPVATNPVAAVVTNFVPVFYTNTVQVPVTNLVISRDGAIEAAGPVTNTFLPGVGSILRWPWAVCITVQADPNRKGTRAVRRRRRAIHHDAAGSGR